MTFNNFEVQVYSEQAGKWYTVWGPGTVREAGLKAYGCRSAMGADKSPVRVVMLRKARDDSAA